MCLIFFSLQTHPSYKLIVAANRDEFYNRGTEPAHYWQDAPEILAGRDVEACGTWMGMNRSGKISMLTNYRDPAHINPAAPSRGQLVSDYLRDNSSAREYLEGIERKGSTFNGFNLLAGNVDELWYYSNYRPGIEKLKPGFYGISNHLLDSPWPKVVRGKEKFQSLLSKAKIDTEEVFALLYDDTLADDSLLPQTGLPMDRERALSSMFIKTENYGSRCSTVVLVDYNNAVTYAERVFDLKTFEFTTQTFQFTPAGPDANIRIS